MSTSVSIPYNTKFGDLLKDENELIDVHRLVELFNSVTPKLYTVLEDSKDSFMSKWDIARQQLSLQKDYKKSCRLILGIETVSKSRYDGFSKSISSFDEVTKKFANRLQDQINMNEKELLLMIFQSKSMIPAILDLLIDVDNLEEDIRSIFKEMVEFLDEIMLHYSSLDNICASGTESIGEKKIAE